MLDKKIFKKYDIRGIYPKEINEEAVRLTTQAVARIFGKGLVIIGYDARLSSKKLYGALKKELTNWPKLKIIEIGLVSTPALYFTVIDQKARGGIMITASHNPKEYNGLKVVGEKAEMMSGEYIWEMINKKNG